MTNASITPQRLLRCERCGLRGYARLDPDAYADWLRRHAGACDPCGQCGEQMGRMTPEARMAHDLMHMRETTEAIARDLAELRSLLGVRDA